MTGFSLVVECNSNLVLLRWILDTFSVHFVGSLSCCTSLHCCEATLRAEQMSRWLGWNVLQKIWFYCLQTLIPHCIFYLVACFWLLMHALALWRRCKILPINATPLHQCNAVFCIKTALNRKKICILHQIYLCNAFFSWHSACEPRKSAENAVIFHSPRDACLPCPLYYCFRGFAVCRFHWYYSQIQVSKQNYGSNVALAWWAYFVANVNFLQSNCDNVLYIYLVSFFLLWMRALPLWPRCKILRISATPLHQCNAVFCIRTA